MALLRDSALSILWEPAYKIRYIGEGNLQAYEAFKNADKSLYPTKREAQKQIAKYVVTGGVGAYVNDFKVSRYYLLLDIGPKLAFSSVMVLVAGAGLVHTLQGVFTS